MVNWQKKIGPHSAEFAQLYGNYHTDPCLIVYNQIQVGYMYFIELASYSDFEESGAQGYQMKTPYQMGF